MFCVDGYHIKHCPRKLHKTCKKVCVPWEDRDKQKQLIGRYPGYSKNYSGFQRTKYEKE